ncbi:MAG: metallophosphoesterase [Pseudomonadota bacterium]
MITTATARTAPGLRLYAVGDLHGDAGALERHLTAIRRDLARRPAEDWRLVFLGDYIDRGPDAFAVLDRLSRLGPEWRAYCLAGNHEHCLLDFLGDADAPSFYPWLEDGGIATLCSYGIDATYPLDFPDAASRRAVRAALAEAMPAAHAGFLAGLAHGARFGDYFFAHAGIRPGTPIASQNVRDLIWAPGFLEHTAPHEAVIVHGHSPVATIEVHPNRIAVDTGAALGPSCLVLEEDLWLELTVDGPYLLATHGQPGAEAALLPLLPAQAA